MKFLCVVFALSCLVSAWPMSDEFQEGNSVAKVVTSDSKSMEIPISILKDLLLCKEMIEEEDSSEIPEIKLDQVSKPVLDLVLEFHGLKNANE